MALEFETPVEGRGATPNAWFGETVELRTRPGEWAIISRRPTRRSAMAMAQNVRSGALTAFRPAGSFEAVSRTVDGEFRVYARYVGNGDDQ